jgi:hypothetical protein
MYSTYARVFGSTVRSSEDFDVKSEQFKDPPRLWWESRTGSSNRPGYNVGRLSDLIIARVEL